MVNSQFVSSQDKINKIKMDSTVGEILKTYGEDPSKNAFWNNAINSCIAAFTYYCLESNIDLDNMETVKALAKSGIRFENAGQTELEEKFEKIKRENPFASCIPLYEQVCLIPEKSKNSILQAVVIRITEVNKKKGLTHDTEKQ